MLILSVGGQYAIPVSAVGLDVIKVASSTVGMVVVEIDFVHGMMTSSALKVV